MSEAVIECRGVTRSFEDGNARVDVLKGIDMTVNAGETVAISGASGSGKSTLLHLLGGLDQPGSGNVMLCGHDLGTIKDRERGLLRNRMLGFVYQFHHLLPEFSALENVAMPLLIGHMRAAEAADRAQAVLERVGLAARANHRPAELSGGERQRVAIARALVNSPKCLLADEPTGNLDARNATTACDLLVELCQQVQAAVVVVTHDQQVAARMNRHYRLDDGRLQPAK
jgi:lipoprotein-releasing system ATP-binding protein